MIGDTARLGSHFLALADASVRLTASCFYRVGPDGGTSDYVLDRIAPGWLDRYSDHFWRLDPLHPARAGGTARIATISPHECRRHRDGERYHQDFLAPQGTVHQVELYFRRQGHIVAGASMLRSAALGPATGADLALLDRMVETIEAAIELTSLPAPARIPGLTPREREIAGLLMRGASDKAIAVTLRVTVPTVKSHVSRILAKSGTRSRAALIARALTSDEMRSS
ncbi:MAG TPA: helix-turn-helix transcriptional regulator [Sphingomonas sp.]